MATKSTRYVSEERHEEYDDPGQATYPDDHLDYEAEAGEPRCATCGELLAWHEEACHVLPGGPPTAPAPAEPDLKVTAEGYAYALGHLAQPVPEALARPIIWRGQLRERHPRTGLVQRVNVYRLDDGYWDCYREEELQAA